MPPAAARAGTSAAKAFAGQPRLENAHAQYGESGQSSTLLLQQSAPSIRHQQPASLHCWRRGSFTRKARGKTSLQVTFSLKYFRIHRHDVVLAFPTMHCQHILQPPQKCACCLRTLSVCSSLLSGIAVSSPAEHGENALRSMSIVGQPCAPLSGSDAHLRHRENSGIASIWQSQAPAQNFQPAAPAAAQLRRQAPGRTAEASIKSRRPAVPLPKGGDKLFGSAGDEPCSR